MVSDRFTVAEVAGRGSFALANKPILSQTWLTMKAPKTKLIVISAIGVASIVGTFLFAESKAPKVGGQDLPVQIVMACVPVDKAKLNRALAGRPKDDYRIQYQGVASVGKLPKMSPSPPPCMAGIVGNATQRVTFKNTQELRSFLDTAGL